MKTHSLFSLLLVALTLLSCQRGSKNLQSDDQDMVVLELKNADLESAGIVEYEQFYDSIKYVVLESIQASLFSEINEVFFVDSLIIIVSRQEGSILFFDQQGHYIRKINRRGNAGYEYNAIWKVMVDEANCHVIVYDKNSSKINRYDFQGKHLVTLRDIPMADDILNLADGGFLCYQPLYHGDYPELPAGLWKLNAQGQFQHYLYQDKEEYPLFMDFMSINNYYLSRTPRGTIAFRDLYGTAIYEIHDDYLQRTAQFNFDEKTKADYQGDHTRTHLVQCISLNAAYEKGDFLFTWWRTPNQKIALVGYSKRDNERYLYETFVANMGDYWLCESFDYVRNNSPNLLTAAVEPSYFARVFNSLSEAQRKLMIQSPYEEGQKIAPENLVLQLNYVKDGAAQ